MSTRQPYKMATDDQTKLCSCRTVHARSRAAGQEHGVITAAYLPEVGGAY